MRKKILYFLSLLKGEGSIILKLPNLDLKNKENLFYYELEDPFTMIKVNVFLDKDDIYVELLIPSKGKDDYIKEYYLITKIQVDLGKIHFFSNL